MNNIEFSLNTAGRMNYKFTVFCNINIPFMDANSFWLYTITIMNNRSQLCLTNCDDKTERNERKPTKPDEM